MYAFILMPLQVHVHTPTGTMTPLAWILVVSLLFSAIALVMTLINRACYRPPESVRPLPPLPGAGARGEANGGTSADLNPDSNAGLNRGSGALPGQGSDAFAAAEPVLISVCIPARNEAENIEACVRAVLAGDHPRVEVLIYDDHSTDATPQILARLAAEDPRVVLVPVESLPAGWNGKQHGCDRMGREARGDWLLFTDADVRLSPDCLRRTLAAACASGADLMSTFPRQITGSAGEAAIIPLIHFILLSYLPMPRMRSSLDPSASAACGQFLFARRSSYLASGGHAAFKDSMHDGVKMPRAFRRAGFRTDLFDGTELASCRMYRGLLATWRGFAKNAFEGLGSVGLLIFITIVHLLAHVLPWAVLGAIAVVLASPPAGPWPLGLGEPVVGMLALACVVLHIIHRGLLAAWFAQSPLTVLLHPLGVLAMTAIQWHSLVLSLTGRRSWRGRVQGPHAPANPGPATGLPS